MFFQYLMGDSWQSLWTAEKTKWPQQIPGLCFSPFILVWYFDDDLYVLLCRIFLLIISPCSKFQPWWVSLLGRCWIKAHSQQVDVGSGFPQAKHWARALAGFVKEFCLCMSGPGLTEPTCISVSELSFGAGGVLSAQGWFELAELSAWVWAWSWEQICCPVDLVSLFDLHENQTINPQINVSIICISFLQEFCLSYQICCNVRTAAASLELG